MAQERAGGARGLARRFGVAGRVAVGVALAGVLAGTVALAALGTGGFEIERTEGDVSAGAAAGSAEEPTEGKAAPGAGEGAEPAAPQAQATLLVHVDGAVARPGVYELAAGSRVVDAVEAAGGLVEGADTAGVNLAASVSDGEKVYVPLEGEEVPAGVSSQSAEAASAPAAPVNINTAGVEELDGLPGIGEATARAIIEDREANGPFAAPEDLMRVSGIGEKKYARLEGLICV